MINKFPLCLFSFLAIYCVTLVPLPGRRVPVWFISYLVENVLGNVAMIIANELHTKQKLSVCVLVICFQVILKKDVIRKLEEIMKAAWLLLGRTSSPECWPLQKNLSTKAGPSMGAELCSFRLSPICCSGGTIVQDWANPWAAAAETLPAIDCLSSKLFLIGDLFHLLCIILFWDMPEPFKTL